MMSSTPAVAQGGPKKSFIDSLLGGIGAVGSNLGSGIQQTATEFGKNTIQGAQYGLQGLQGIAAAPIRVGATLADLPFQAAGKAPVKPFDVPGIGKVSTYARQAVDNTPSQGPVAAGIGAASQGILDTAGIGLAAKGLVGSAKPAAAPKPAPAAAQAPSSGASAFDGSQKLYRGENPSNTGGLHFTTDEGWAKNFGDKMYSGNLPANAKVYNLRPEDMQQGFESGFTNENQLYNSIFDKGYDAIVGHDAMNSRVPDIIVNPAIRDSFKSSASAVNPVNVANMHLKSSDMILKELGQEGVNANGGMPALLGRTQTNIADALKAYGLTDKANAISGLKISPTMNLDMFRRATLDALATP